MARADRPQALGQWRNAPLVFVLAQVRFPAQPEGFTEKMQLLVCKQQPGRYLAAQATPIVHVSVELELGGVPKQNVVQTGMGYNIARSDGRMMVRVEPGSLTVAVNEYVDFDHLMAQWFPLIACLQEAGLQGSVQRLGLRYVDFVIPAEDAAPEDYLKEPWNQKATPEFPGAIGTPGMCVSLHDMEFPKGRMRLQYLRGFGQPSLPADLLGLLAPAPKSPPMGAASAVIDTDRWMEDHWVLEGDAIKGDFRQMHKDLAALFNTIISTRARTEWKSNAATGVAS